MKIIKVWNLFIPQGIEMCQQCTPMQAAENEQRYRVKLQI